MLSQIIKGVKHQKSSSSESFVDLLHYRYMSILLLCCSAIVSSKQYFANPVLCINGSKYRDEFINTYCWIHATYDEKGKHVTYYQYVGLFLMLEAVCYYIPHILWKYYSSIKSEKLEKSDAMLYFIVYIIHSIIQVANNIFQFLVISTFLQVNFFTFGIYYSSLTIFPLVTKCSVYNYGASGDLQFTENRCILPINAINDKMFILVWVSLWLTLCCSILQLVHLLLTTVSSWYRQKVEPKSQHSSGCHLFIIRCGKEIVFKSEHEL
jgi:innexin